MTIISAGAQPANPVVRATPAALEAGLRSYNARIRQAQADQSRSDDTFDVLTDEGYALCEQVEALPNTPEHLRLRVLAIGAATDNSEDPANLDLNELAAHIDSNAGRLVRQVLTCVAGKVSEEPTPFRRAHDLFLAKRAAYEALPEGVDLRINDEAERAFLDAAVAMDATPVSSWAEFADAYIAACDDGESRIIEQNQLKLLADVRRLSGRPAPTEWEVALAAFREAEAATDHHWNTVEEPANLAGRMTPAIHAESDELTVAKGHAEDRLFETTAPNIAALRVKLELLWADKRHPIPEFQQLILADMRRLSSGKA